MSSMYFYLYALEQPVVGYLTDRLGPRRVIGYWSMAAAAGCFLFGIAPNIGWASLGRALIGLGVGGVYVPGVKAVSLWFRKNDFATMIGLLMSMGNLGAVIATTPLAWAAGSWGWRPTFFMIGAITLGLAVVTLVFTRDYTGPIETLQKNSIETSVGQANLKTSAVRVLASGQFWVVAVIFFGVYGTLVTLQGLWATPFLMTVLEIERMFASKLNMLIPLGVIIGAPIFGWIIDRFSLNKRNTLIGILSIYTLTWVGIIFFYNQLWIVGLSLILFVMGIATGGFISALWGIVRETTALEILGLASGMLNPAPFLGVAAFQILTGVILDRAGHVGGLYPITAFKNAFLVCLFCIIFCFLLSFFLRKSNQPEEF